MKGWREYRLGDAIHINPPRELQRGAESAYVAMDDLGLWTRQISRWARREFSGSGSRFRNGDTLLARITPCLENGKTAYVTFLADGEVAHGSTEFIVLSGRDGKSDDLFVYYLARSEPFREFAIQRMEGSSGRQRVPAPAIAGFEVAVPPLSEQRAIAGVLGALDDKIELNRRMNETLEAIAQAEFRRMKNDGGRKGWRVEKLGDLIELAYGDALKEENRRPGSIPVFGSNGQIGWHDQALVKGPGIVVGRKGNPGIVTWSHTDFFPIDTTFYVVPKTDCRSLYFLYYALRDQDLASLGADSAVPGLNRNMAYLSKEIVPPPAVLEQFDQVVAPLYARIHANDEESRTLAALRDALLPKLLSGAVRVKEKTT